MRLPDLLPERWHDLAKADSDRALFALLCPQVAGLVDFFEHACEDETWCEEHHVFFVDTLNWLTKRFFQRQLGWHFAEKVTARLQKHAPAFDHLIPKQLTVFVRGNAHPMNALMLGACSELLFSQIYRECDDSGQGQITLSQRISLAHFAFLKQYVESHRVDELWKLEPKEILTLYTEAKSLGLKGFSALCTDILKRYLTVENVIDYLFLAISELWESLKDECIDFVNAHFSGITLYSKTIEELAFEFHTFTPQALELFKRLKHLITHFMCHGELTEDPHFSAVITQCPYLIGIDLSRSATFSPLLSALPKILAVLDLSQCPWLSDEIINTIVDFCPQLTALHLRGNRQLSYRAWPALLHLTRLEVLTLSECDQIADEELKLIAQAAPQLQELHLAFCRQVTAEGFLSLGLICPHLISINLAHSSITDQGLTGLASYCRGLREIDLTDCLQVSERGVRETLRLLPLLQRLHLNGCALSEEFIQDLQGHYLHLQVD